MALRSPTECHSSWGSFPTGSLPTSTDVQVGDTAFDTTLGHQVVCASTGPVVWHLVGTEKVATVADIAALALLDDTTFTSGTLAYVTSLRSYFQKGAFKVVAVPTVTEVQCVSGTGTWYRLGVGAASQTWADQATWYIDPLNGNDQNDGSSTAAGGSPGYVGAIKTWAEFTRRVRLVNVAMTVTVTSDIAEAMIGSFVAGNSAASLTLVGASTIAITATGTTFTDPVRSGVQSPGTMTAGNIADFTPYLGKMLRTASGTVRYAPIIGLNGAAPYLPYWATEALSNNIAANGTSIDILTLTTAPTVVLDVVGLPVIVRTFKFTTTTFALAPTIRTTLPSVNTGVTFTGCEFVSTINVGGVTYFVGCLLTGTGTIYVPVSQARFVGGGSSARTTILTTGSLQFQGFISYGGGGVTIGNGSNYNQPTYLMSSAGAAGLGVFASTGAGLTVHGTPVVASLQSLFGSGNATYGLVVNYGARVWVASTPTITGTSGDLQFCGAGTAIPPLTASAAVPAASALTTWTHFTSAPFSSKVFNYGNGTSLAGA